MKTNHEPMTMPEYYFSHHRPVDGRFCTFVLRSSQPIWSLFQMHRLCTIIVIKIYAVINVI